MTFRTADSLPQEKLHQWLSEREEWLRQNPEPHSERKRLEYWERFPARFQCWLDQGHGACVLARSEIRKLIESALRHFDGERYQLLDEVVMPNHVHVVVTPFGEYLLSSIVHSWKSFSANRINAVLGCRGAFCQKESFDHIVRSAESLQKFKEIYRGESKM